MRRKRYKDWLAFAWCLVFDLTDPWANLYREDVHTPASWVGGKAQEVWFRAHNNRFYSWLEEDDG